MKNIFSHGANTAQAFAGQKSSCGSSPFNFFFIKSAMQADTICDVLDF